MARPIKETLDWFTHDKGARNDHKLKRVMRRWGSHAYAVYFMLLEMLIEHKDMQLSLANAEDAEVVAEETRSRDTIHLYDVIDSLVEVGLFDFHMWQSERIVFSPSLYQRYDSRLEANRKAAQRKRRSREAEFYQDKQERLEQLVNNSHEIQETETETETDPDPDNRSRSRSRSRSIYRASQRDNLGQPRDNPVVTRDNEEDKQALQFMKRPWRKEGGRIDNGFLEFVGKQLPQNGDEHPKTKGRSHILNLERSGPWEKLAGYWEDYQDSAAAQTKPAPQPVAAAAMPKVGSPEYSAQLRAMAAKRAGVELPPPTEKT